MNVNLTIREMKELLWVLANADTAPRNIPLVDEIMQKLSETVNVSRWNSISTLIPLGVKVLVRNSHGHEYFATRHEMANSYAPTHQKVVMETGEEVQLDLGFDIWTQYFD